MSLRRLLAGGLAAISLTTGLVLAPIGPATAAPPPITAKLPTANPANYTPNVLDGEVDAIWQVGNKVIIGGTFTQVANATSNGGAVYNRSYLAAFDATTGVVDPNFNPVLNSYVTTILPAEDGTSIYIGGDFNTISGINRRKVARLNVADGSVVTSFINVAANGVVKDLRLSGGQLYAAGLFTMINGQSRARLASLNPTTGAATSKLNLSITGTQNGGTTNVLKFDVTPDGSRMLIIGNFTTVGGLARRQVAMLDLTTDPVTVSPWDTTFFTSTCSASFDTYLRDVDISEDGTFAVITTTGAFRANTSCDTNSRFELGTESAGRTPTWVNVTGGDTSYAVEVHDGVAYVGGHFRWVNNPIPPGGDQVGAGSVPRDGVVALDVRTGLPFSWNPGRDRGVGLFDFHVTPQGLWAGSDTDRWANELRQKLAFFPWSSGSQVPANDIGVLPNDVILLGRTAGTTGTDPSVLYRVNAGGPAVASADDGPDWAVDTSASPSALHNTGASTTTNALTVATTDGTVPTSDFDRPPAALWSTERYDPASGNEMQWNLNVTAGRQIQVRLYLGNKSTGTDEVGQRIFDVDIDGVNVIDDLDLAATPGHNIGTMRAFNITSDGQVNILFRHGAANNPLINGIEVIDRTLPLNGSLGQQDETQARRFDGTTVGPNAVSAGTAPWRTVRGSFAINGALYTLHLDGTLVRRSFDGTTFGPGTAMPTYANNILADAPTMSGTFFDPATDRVYYTQTSPAGLYYRSFLPENAVFGAVKGTVAASSALTSLNPGRVRGMFLADGFLWFADTTTGNLWKIGWSGGAPTGTATVVDTTIDWRARAMFMSTNAQPNVLPVAAFTPTCSVNVCSFDATASHDSDGTITGYAWDFGDGATATGSLADHPYSAAGTYVVGLTVTDDAGATHLVTHEVTVTDPPNLVPTSVTIASNCQLLACTFSGTATDADGTIVDYAWDFGDGETATGATPAHAYATGGAYDVELTVTDDDGATASTTTTVDVIEPAQAALFRASASANGSGVNASVVVPPAVQAGDQLVLVVTANTATTATTPAGWTLLGTESDGSPDMRSWVFTRTADATSAGATVTSVLGGGAGGKSSRIVAAYSNADPVTSATSSTIGALSTTLTTPATTNLPGASIVSYWSDKSADNSGWTLPATVQARASSVGAASGRITAALADAVVATGSWAGATATSGSTLPGTKGIGWSIVVPVLVPPPPNVAPTAAFTSSCSSLTCVLTSTSSDGDGTVASYAWDFGDGTTSTEADPSHTYGADGPYTISLVVTDDDGDASLATTAEVVVALLDAHVAFRAVSSANSTTANASAAIPASVQAGDQLVLFVTANVATSITTPSGWTLLGTAEDGSPDLRSWVFTRTAGPTSAGSTATAVLSASGKVSRLLVAYAQASPITLATSSVMGPTSDLLTSPTAEAPANGSFVVSYWADKSAGNTGWALPAEVTSRGASLGSGSGQVTAAVGDTAVPAGTWAGATAQTSIAGAKGIAWSVVVAPL